MYHFGKPTRTTLKVNKAYQGETIETKVERIVNNNEPITDGADIFYQTREEGVNPYHDIRTDRFDQAYEVSDHVTKTELAKRQGRIDARRKSKKGDDTTPLQGTNDSKSTD